MEDKAAGRHEHGHLSARALRSLLLMLCTALALASLRLFVLAPQYLQLVRDYSPLQAAVALLVIPVGVGVGTAVVPSAMARVGARWPGTGGLVFMAAGFAILAVTVGAGGLVWLATGLVVFGVGFGLAVTPGTVLIIDGLPPHRRSVASAVNDVTREVGGVIGIAVLSSTLIATYRDSIEGTLGGLPPAVADPVRDGAGAALGVAAGLGPDGVVLADAARTAFSTGLSSALWIGAAVPAVAAVICGVLALGHTRGASTAPHTTEDSADDFSTPRNATSPA